MWPSVWCAKRSSRCATGVTKRVFGCGWSRHCAPRRNVRYRTPTKSRALSISCRGWAKARPITLLLRQSSALSVCTVIVIRQSSRRLPRLRVAKNAGSASLQNYRLILKCPARVVFDRLIRGGGYSTAGVAGTSAIAEIGPPGTTTIDTCDLADPVTATIVGFQAVFETSNRPCQCVQRTTRRQVSGSISVVSKCTLIVQAKAEPTVVQVAKFTRACSYDTPQNGSSTDPTTSTEDVFRRVDEQAKF
jgi:hypothetical protein